MAEIVGESAHAKINPYLRVLGKRRDSYHDIETLILPVTLEEELTVTSLADHLIWKMDVVNVDETQPAIPIDSSNLANKAVEELRQALDRSTGAQITIEKRIPVAAGLGGGSADAAATLRALGKLWGVGIEVLLEVAAKVGSDVPAMLHKRPVIARGRGERVDFVDLPSTSWVLVTQAFGVRSGDAYRWWDEDGGVTGPDSIDVLNALVGGDLERAAGLMYNDLEQPVASRHSEVAAARQRLLDAGALGAVMSGSGPTVAGLARDSAHAEEIARGTESLAVSSLGS